MAESRPTALAEVRAWAFATVALVVHTVGLTWWGATLTAKVDHQTQLLGMVVTVNEKLENRVRLLEQEVSALRVPKNP